MTRTESNHHSPPSRLLRHSKKTYGRQFWASSRMYGLHYNQCAANTPFHSLSWASTKPARQALLVLALVHTVLLLLQYCTVPFVCKCGFCTVPNQSNCMNRVLFSFNTEELICLKGTAYLEINLARIYLTKKIIENRGVSKIYLIRCRCIFKGANKF